MSTVTDLTTQALDLIGEQLKDAKRPAITSSFQSECVVLTDLLRQVQPDIPVLFLETFHHFANGRSHHFARDGIDGGLAGREWQAGLGHGADAFAGKEGNAGTRPARSDSCLDQGAMRDVRIVPGIFHDSRGRPSVEGFEDSNCKADTCAIRKPHVDGIRALTSDERLVCRACGGRRAGARGPAALERLIRSGLICICGVAHVLFQSGAPKLNTISS